MAVTTADGYHSHVLTRYADHGFFTAVSFYLPSLCFQGGPAMTTLQRNQSARAFGRALKAARLERGLSQEDLAESFGVSRFPIREKNIYDKVRGSMRSWIKDLF